MKKFMKWQDQLGTMRFKKGLLLLLGALIALISIPAAISAAASGDDTYIKVTLIEPDNYTYRDLIVKNVENLDPLDGDTPVVNLLDYASSKALNLPTIGKLVRKFDPAAGTYSHDGESIDVRITPAEKISHSLPGVYQNYLVYTERTFPDFSVIGNGTAYADDYGNVLLIKCPKNNGKEAAGLTELFKEPFKEGYLFNTEGILYFSTDAKKVAVWPSEAVMPYNTSNLTYTLDNNKVPLGYFCPNMSAVRAFSPGGGQGEYAPEPGEYLIMVVKYDSNSKKMRIIAAMPVLILKSDTKVIWSEENPYYQDSQKSVTISFNETVDNISYALVKKDPSGLYYDLDINVDTRKLAEQGMDVTNLDGLIPILHAITQSNSSITYTLKPNGQEATLEKYGGLVIAEGYGCAGYANSNSVNVAAATLQKLNPGDYYLYAMGIKDQKVVAVDQKEVVIKANRPTPTPGGGGGGGSPSGGGPSGPTEPSGPVAYEGTGSLMTDSTGIVVQSIAVSAVDGVATVIVPAGVQALDANGNPITEVGIEPLASDAVPAVPAGAVFAFAGYAYVASPAGATFDPAITLTLEIPEDVWNTLDLESEQLSVKWYNEETGLWENIPTTFDPETRTVRATVTHFSIFALFTEPVPETTTPTETPTTTTTTTAPGGETPTEGLPVTMILGIFVVVIIIAAAGYFLLKRK